MLYVTGSGAPTRALAPRGTEPAAQGEALGCTFASGQIFARTPVHGYYLVGNTYRTDATLVPQCKY
jgi:hypothetical protein